MKLEEALKLHKIYNVYKPESKTRYSKVDWKEWNKYLKCNGEIDYYEDYDGDDENGKPIIIRYCNFMLKKEK